MRDFLIPLFMGYWGREKVETAKQTRICTNEVDVPRRGGLAIYTYNESMSQVCKIAPNCAFQIYMYSE